jgi:hypothetical protein
MTWISTGIALLQNGGGGNASGWITPELSLVIAAVAGALLSSFGAYLNDYFTRRREDKKAEREDAWRRKQHEREEKMREEQEDLRKRQERARVYKELVKATTFHVTDPEERELSADEEAERLYKLNESYTDVLLNASDNVNVVASNLYKAAVEAIESGTYDKFGLVARRREAFWDAARYELDQGD